jgi:hypothetical protein
VLYDVELRAFLSSCVLLKHRAGVETIAYTLFPSEFGPALELRKPRPPTATEIAATRQKAEAAAAFMNQQNDEARAETRESVRISKAADRSAEIGVESALEKHISAARDRVRKYFKYEYVLGSGPTSVEVETETPEEIMGWHGSYRIRGKAYLAFDYGRAVRAFLVETTTRNGVVTATIVRVE